MRITRMGNGLKVHSVGGTYVMSLGLQGRAFPFQAASTRRRVAIRYFADTQPILFSS